ncbi:SDR family oxidoreductase [Streptomyces sp. NPDC051987]|uniref:SDR family NAD(P)-dependent oxidoreductase n=1 Tax=Streptomyces sp. NPDC051987 TaxID=3155808 RepID=UPI0034178AA5
MSEQPPSPPRRFEGRTVLVTGAGTGYGAEIAVRAPQYAAAKYGILGITKSYAQAFAPAVRVNTFAPGFIETEKLRGRADSRSGRREDMIAKAPMGRIPGPAELAGTALFLATDAAAHMTGVYLNADGGFTMIGA